MRTFEDAKSDIEPLADLLQRIFVQMSVPLNEATMTEKKASWSYFKVHCLFMLLVPLIGLLLFILGIVFWGAEGIVFAFLSYFGLFVTGFVALMVAMGFAIYKMVKAKRDAAAEVRKYDIKMEVMKPFLDIILNQETGYLKKGSIAELIPKRMIEEGVFTGIQPSDYLTDIIRARFDETDVIFGEKRTQIPGTVKARPGNTDLGPLDIEDASNHRPTMGMGSDSLFMLVDFHKNFEGSMVVKTRMKGESISDLWKMRRREVMGNPHFDDRFAVYSTSPTLARYLLSPLLMERMVQIIDHYRCGFDLFFRNGDMLIQLDWGKNMLDVSLHEFIRTRPKEIELLGLTLSYTTASSFKTIDIKDIDVQVEDFKRHYDDIASVYSLIDIMRQNVRLWK